MGNWCSGGQGWGGARATVESRDRVVETSDGNGLEIVVRKRRRPRKNLVVETSDGDKVLCLRCLCGMVIWQFIWVLWS